jgi:hypothetical protein
MPPKYSAVCTDLITQLGVQVSPRGKSVEKDQVVMQSNFYLVSITKSGKKSKH